MDIQMKGCWSNNEQCNRAQCINNDPALKKNVGFCCCNDDLCNQVHSWHPIAPVITEESEFVFCFYYFFTLHDYFDYIVMF